jgi:hypothetical protein
MGMSKGTVVYTNHYLFQNRNLLRPYNEPPPPVNDTYPKPQIKVFYFIMGNTKMENDSDIREGNEKYYLYLQYLYELLLQKLNVNTEFKKSNNMGINEYNYDLTRAFLTLFSQIVTGL